MRSKSRSTSFPFEDKRTAVPPEPNVRQADIRAAYAVIAPHVRRTPLIENASPIAGLPPISLKLECLQHAGSFKPRGAFHNLLTRAAPPTGCATASGGNHGAAVAYAAGRLGIRARVFVPEIAAPPKIAKIKAYGAEVVVKGAAYADAQTLCDAYVAESGALAIHPYATATTVAGQGTVGLEWEEDLMRLGLPPIDTALVAVGGGGLVAGIAAWFDGRVKVVGVEPEGSRALDAALAAGEPVDVPVHSVAADSLGARSVGALNLAIAQRAVDHVALVGDAAIGEAQRRLWRELQIAVEPGGAAAYAALESGAYRPAAGERVGVVVCGANVELGALAQRVAG
jgi:threonine dehydratase